MKKNVPSVHTSKSLYVELEVTLCAYKRGRFQLILFTIYQFFFSFPKISYKLFEESFEGEMFL